MGVKVTAGTRAWRVSRLQADEEGAWEKRVSEARKVIEGQAERGSSHRAHSRLKQVCWSLSARGGSRIGVSRALEATGSDFGFIQRKTWKPLKDFSR